MSRTADAGFTLVECLVAMAVLAVAAAGLVGAAQAHIDAVEGLRARALAQWVAENRLAELQLALPEASARQVTMLGQAFEVAVAATPTADPDLSLVEIQVRRPGRQQADARLRGAVDQGGGRP